MNQSSSNKIDEANPRLWTRPFITLSLASFLLFINLQMLLSSFSTHVKGNLGGEDIHVSLAISIFSIAAIISRTFTGKWIRSLTRDGVLTIGVVVTLVSTFLSALPDTVAPFLVMRAIYGLGFGIGSTVIPTLVAQIIPPKRMGEGIGYYGLSTTLATCIGPATGMYVMKEAGFTTLSIIGVGAVLCMIPMLLLSRVYRFDGKMFVPARTNSKQEQGDKKESETKLVQTASAKVNANGGAKKRKPILFIPEIWFAALMNIFMSITYSGLLSFIAVYGEQISLDNIGLFFMFNALTVLVVRPISGKIFDKKGPNIVLVPAAISVICSMLLLSYTESFGMLVVSALLYGLGFGSIQPTLQAWMLRTVDKEHYGTVNGIYYNATDVGVAVGSIILGIVATMSSYEVMYRMSSLIMVMFAIAVISFFTVMKKRKQGNAKQTS